MQPKISNTFSIEIILCCTNQSQSTQPLNLNMAFILNKATQNNYPLKLNKKLYVVNGKLINSDTKNFNSTLLISPIE
jgi:hypothetical protein